MKKKSQKFTILHSNDMHGDFMSEVEEGSGKLIGGFDIMFIGIITEMVMDKIALDELIATFVSIEDAAEEVGKICNAYKNHDIDLTVALTHIGFESDLKLAGLLKPEWGVDMILGGHTHIILDQPAIVNDILIAQAGYGTDQIGRFDIVVDEASNSIIDWKWELVPINNEIAPVDQSLEEFLNNYKNQIDEKYNVIISRLSRKVTHPSRVEETSLGNLFADALAYNGQTDVILLGSGSIRAHELGPVVTLGSLKEAFPYEDSLIKYCIRGKQLKTIFSHFMRIENRNGEGECFQVNKNVEAIYSDLKGQLESLKLNDKEVEDDKQYTITVQGYHAANSKKNLGLEAEELKALGLEKVVSTSDYDVIEEWCFCQQESVPPC